MKFVLLALCCILGAAACEEYVEHPHRHAYYRDYRYYPNGYPSDYYGYNDTYSDYGWPYSERAYVRRYRVYRY